MMFFEEALSELISKIFMCVRIHFVKYREMMQKGGIKSSMIVEKCQRSIFNVYI